MNGKERIAAIMTGRVPDRVPVWAQLSDGHLTRNAGFSLGEPADPRLVAKAERVLYPRYGFDAISVVSATPYIPFAPGQAWGGWPEPGEERSLEDIDPGRWPDLETHITDEWAEPYDLAREELGATMHVSGWLIDSFTQACVWCGSVQQAMLLIMDFPDRFQRLVEYMDQLNDATALALVTRARVDSVGFSSPYAGSTFVSREHYTRFVAPSLTHGAEFLAARGMPTYIHTCGYTGDRLEMEAETGVTGIECMDPPPLGNVDLAEAKKRIGHRVFLKGNVDSVNVLLRGTDREVEAEITRQIQVGMPGGGYILSSACSVAPAVDPARIHLMVTLAERHGRYAVG
jgi:hypothetical protein